MIKAKDQDDVMHCYWVMMKECESKAMNDNDLVLKHQVEGFFRLWNRVNETDHAPRWVKE